MDTSPDKKLVHNRLLLLILALVIGISLAVLVFGNPITWVLDRWSAIQGENIITQQPLTLPSVLSHSIWQGLTKHGQLPITASTTGRSNPFISGSVEAPKPEDRDVRRIGDIKAIRDALRAHKIAYGQYPDGTTTIIGSVDAACLTDKGWQPRSVCVFDVGVVPMPADPGKSSYTYSTTGDGYEVKFSLEEKTSNYVAGDHTLTPAGIE